MSIQYKIGLVIGLGLLCTNAWSKPLYVTNLGIGNKSMFVDIGERNFKVLFTSLDASWSVVKGDWFTSIGYEQSIKDGLQTYDQSVDFGGGNKVESKGIIVHERSDVSLTLGYRVSGAVSLFVGVRQGQTGSYLSATKIDSTTVQGISSYARIKSSGVFAGINLSYRFSDNSSLSGSVAMAKLTGSASLAEPYVDTSNYKDAAPGTIPSTVDGDALGFSYVLAWSNPISEKAAINLKAKLHRYHFDDKRAAGGFDLSYDENFTSGLVEFTYRL